MSNPISGQKSVALPMDRIFPVSTTKDVAIHIIQSVKTQKEVAALKNIPYIVTNKDTPFDSQLLDYLNFLIANPRAPIVG